MLLALLLASALLAPQDPASTQPAADPQVAAKVAAAVRSLSGGSGVYLIGAVSETKPEAAEEEDSGVGMRIMIGAGMEEAAPYLGGFEALLTEKKELLLASIGGLPEVVIYDDGTQRLVRTTISDEPVSAKRLAQDLGSLLDLVHLAGQIERSTKITEHAARADGSRAFDCELSPRAVRVPDGGLRDLMAPKVLSVRARIDLDPKGVVAAMELSVQRTDPMADIRRNALTHVGGGSSERIVQMSGGLPKNDAPGGTSLYRLRASDEIPSAHAREALFALRKLAGNK